MSKGLHELPKPVNNDKVFKLRVPFNEKYSFIRQYIEMMFKITLCLKTEVLFESNKHLSNHLNRNQFYVYVLFRKHLLVNMF